MSPALATRLPAELKTSIQSIIPDAKFRLDGAIETKSGQLYLPLSPPKPGAPVKSAAAPGDKAAKPASALVGSGDKGAKPASVPAGSGDKGAKPASVTSSDKPTKPTSPAVAVAGPVQLKERVPAEGQPDALYFSDGWCFLRVLKAGNTSTTIGIVALPAAFRKQLTLCKFVPDLIVPENFSVPPALKAAIGELEIGVAVEAPKSKVAPVAPGQTAEQSVPTKAIQATAGSGAIFICSPASGKISMLDGATFEKLTDFPTEGTPAGMAAAEGRLYIADQGKNRILVLDPKKKQFLGQIDLPPKSAPTGIAALPNGKLLYASESAGNNIDVIETATGRVLLKTKVAAGPSKLVMAPNGSVVCVLNPPCSQVTLINTANQKVLGAVKVGNLPNAVAFSKDSTLVYVSNRNSNSVTVIDIARKLPIANIATGVGPTGLVLTKDGDKLLVANAKDNTITIVDTLKRTKISEVKLPLDVDFPKSLYMMPDGLHVVVSSASTDTVGILNMEKLEFEKLPQVGHTSDEMLWMSLD